MKYNFIRTTDSETKDILLKHNFTLVSQDGDVYTFLNDRPLSFGYTDGKMQYTNMLAI